MKPFFITVPHSGEKVPNEAYWLNGLNETTLMCDVDRFVDQLYQPAARKLKIPIIIAEWHRYIADLNRLPDDVDCDAVTGNYNPSGTFPMGLHWVKTTTGETLMKSPISAKLHNDFVEKYFNPFHALVVKQFDDFKNSGFKSIYHLDAHSMPSQGTKAHRDPGAKRPEIVVSDVDGTSCESRFKDIVISAYESAGFQVSYNWPYKGGRLTQTYGKPLKNQHTLQVEMNRALYMNETTKQKNALLWDNVVSKVEKAIRLISDQL